MLPWPPARPNPAKPLPGWKRIENPVARELARHFRIMAGSWLRSDDADYEYDGGTIAEYREWVRARLRESVLFAQVAAGMSALPDIREAVPPIQKSIERLHYPRSLRASAPHLVRNLEWYLDQTTKPKLPAGFSFQLCLYLLWAGTGIPIVANSIVYGGMPQEVYAWLGLNIVAFSYLISRGTLCSGEQRGSEKFRINAAELYRYLVELHVEQDVS